MQWGSGGHRPPQVQHALSAVPEGLQNLDHHMAGQVAKLLPPLVTWKMGIPEGTGVISWGDRRRRGDEERRSGEEGGERKEEKGDRRQEEVAREGLVAIFRDGAFLPSLVPGMYCSLSGCHPLLCSTYKRIHIVDP